MFWLETAASILMGTIGGYLMYRGKKIQQPKMIIWGGVLVLLSWWLFSSGGGKDDDATKAALNTIMPGAADQSQTQVQP
jgi:hypothetical protein